MSRDLGAAVGVYSDVPDEALMGKHSARQIVQGWCNTRTCSTLFEMKNSDELQNPTPLYDNMESSPRSHTARMDGDKPKRKKFVSWLVPDCLKKQSVKKSSCAESCEGFLYWCVTILVL